MKPKILDLPGVNVQWPWTQKILEGTKVVETRFYKMPEKYINQPIAMIETPGKAGKFKARIVAIITFGEPFSYADKKAFRLDFKRHGVTEDGNDFGWKDGKTKWGWPILNVKKLTKPSVAKSPRGIVFCSHCKIPMQHVQL